MTADAPVVSVRATVSGRRRLMLQIVHGDAIDATGADLWASSLGQVDTRS